MTQVADGFRQWKIRRLQTDSSGGNRSRRALGSGTSLSGNPYQRRAPRAPPESGLGAPESAVGRDWYSNQAARIPGGGKPISLRLHC